MVSLSVIARLIARFIVLQFKFGSDNILTFSIKKCTLSVYASVIFFN